jgi:hypothetical protein
VAVSVCLNSVPVVNYSETFYLLSCAMDKKWLLNEDEP